MLRKAQERTVERVARQLAEGEMPLANTDLERHERMRSALLKTSGTKIVVTEWGVKLPSPEISFEFLEQLTALSPYIARLSLKLTVDDYQGCWSLPLAKEHDTKGRGKYPLITDTANNARSTMAHRYTWKLLIDPSITSNQYLDHLCRVHACCNITHLEPVTSSVNTKRGNDARHILGGQTPLFHAE